MLTKCPLCRSPVEKLLATTPMRLLRPLLSEHGALVELARLFLCKPVGWPLQPIWTVLTLTAVCPSAPPSSIQTAGVSCAQVCVLHITQQCSDRAYGRDLVPSSLIFLRGRPWAELDGLVQICVGEYFRKEGRVRPQDNSSIPWKQLTALMMDR